MGVHRTFESSITVEHAVTPQINVGLISSGGELLNNVNLNDPVITSFRLALHCPRQDKRPRS